MSKHRRRVRHRHRFSEPAYVALPDGDIEGKDFRADVTSDGEESARPRDLWRAVDALTQPHRSRLRQIDGTTKMVTVPSLWDQLVEAIDSGAGKHTGGSRSSSKAPCDDSALSLTLTIATGVRDGCLALGLKRTRDVPKDLRAIVTAINHRRIQHELDTTRDTLRSWAGRIRAAISNNPDAAWRMHGAACRVCSSTSVPVWDEDGTETRQPALIVHSTHGVITDVECAACGTKLAGDDLTHIIRDTLKLYRSPDAKVDP